MSQSNTDIIKTLEGMDQEAKSYRKKLLELCWYMRGGISYTEIMDMAVGDISILNEIIKDNFEATKKTGVSFI